MSDAAQFAALGLNREDIETHLDEAAAHAAASVGALLAPLPEDLAGELYRILLAAALPAEQTETVVRTFRSRVGKVLLDPARLEQMARTAKLALAASALTLAARYYAQGMRAGMAPDPSDSPTRPGIPSRMPRRPPEE